MKIFLAGSRVQGHALMAILLPPPHPACSHEQSAGISCAICMPLFEVLKNFNFSLQVTVEKIYRYFSLQVLLNREVDFNWPFSTIMPLTTQNVCEMFSRCVHFWSGPCQAD